MKLNHSRDIGQFVHAQISSLPVVYFLVRVAPLAPQDGEVLLAVDGLHGRAHALGPQADVTDLREKLSISYSEFVS